VFPRQEIAGAVHQQAVLPLAFVTTPLSSSLAIWGVPSPIVVDSRFTIRIGARSSGCCPLNGAMVEILDDSGTVLRSGQLGDVPWEGTSALYWTDVVLTAPATEGLASWRARLTATGCEVPHDEATAVFSFAVVRPPEHRLTIVITEQDTEVPIERAHVRLGPFRTVTDACGMAEISIPTGTYEVKVWHAGFETPATTVDITADVKLQLAGVAVPEDDSSAPWMM
jgi:hypothetical protein